MSRLLWRENISLISSQKQNNVSPHFVATFLLVALFVSVVVVIGYCVKCFIMNIILSVFVLLKPHKQFLIDSK